MFQKLKKFYVFTTKPKHGDLVCDSQRWIKRKVCYEDKRTKK
ncbi:MULTISPECIES: hypothetical protein [Malaciobacter]|nr:MULTISPECIES: hypothetical protein [Malaciobacter]